MLFIFCRAKTPGKLIQDKIKTMYAFKIAATFRRIFVLNLFEVIRL